MANSTFIFAKDTGTDTEVAVNIIDLLLKFVSGSGEKDG
jgi:hypothetical protein